MRHLLFVLLVGQLHAQSQPPVPAPSKSSQVKQQSTTGKDSQADPSKNVSPVTVTVVNAPVTQDPTKHEQNPPSDEWWMRILTAVIAAAAVAQAFIYRRQTRLMREALTETTKAANAAKKSADALINSERAWLIPENFQTDATAHFFRFKNWGRTPAHLKEIRCAYVAVLAEDVWPIDYTTVRELDCPSNPIAPQAVTDLYGVDLVLEPGDNPKRRRHVYGIVRYTDIGERERTITFYWTLNDPPPKWVKNGPPDANRYT